MVLIDENDNLSCDSSSKPSSQSQIKKYVKKSKRVEATKCVNVSLKRTERCHVVLKTRQPTHIVNE
jgi:hypothetical protein